MSETGNAISQARAELAAVGGEIFSDLCDLVAPSMVAQGDGHTLTETVVATNIPCDIEQVSGGGVQVNDNGSVAIKTHRIKMVYTAQTVAIDRQYKIKVKANGVNPEIVCEHPVNLPDSKSPFMTVLAVKADGYRRPGVT